jgi:hypothetical protein
VGFFSLGCTDDVIYDAPIEHLPELAQPGSSPDRLVEVAFDHREEGLDLASLGVEINVQAGAIHPIEDGELAVFDHRSNTGVPAPLPAIASVVALVAEENIHRLYLMIPLDDLPAYMGIVRFPYRAVHAEERQ